MPDPNLPTVGGSEDAWGTELNTFLTIAHEPSGADGGKLKVTALNRAFTGAINLGSATSVTLPANTAIGTVSSTEIGYIDGVTSAIQTQLNDTSSSLVTHKADNSVHITTSQNTLLDNLTATYTNLNTVDTSSSITTQLGTKATVSDFNTHVSSYNTHISDTSAHITTSQNTLLDNLTATYTELNYTGGVTSSIQTQLNDTSSSLYTHKADDSVHITTSQNTLLDGITVTYTNLNTVDTSSSITTQLGTKATVTDFNNHISDYNTHVSDTSAHITTSQNTLLDNLTATYTQLNTVDTSSSITTQLGTKVPIITFDAHVADTSAHISLNTPHTWTKAQVVSQYDLGIVNGTINTDASLSNVFMMVLNGASTLANPTNLVSGGTYTWNINQDTSGSRTLNYDTLFKFPTGDSSAVSIAANAKDTLTCLYDSSILRCNLKKNFV